LGRHIQKLIIIGVRFILWCPANPPGIKQGFPGKVAITDSQGIPKDIFPLDKEGPFLFKKRFKGSQIYFGGICLHLTEIRIDGKIHGHVTG
jgi:hypothetical protein